MAYMPQIWPAQDSFLTVRLQISIIGELAHSVCSQEDMLSISSIAPITHTALDGAMDGLGWK
jgi:hypothetical protein